MVVLLQPCWLGGWLVHWSVVPHWGLPTLGHRLLAEMALLHQQLQELLMYCLGSMLLLAVQLVGPLVLLLLPLLVLVLLLALA
jgi:hypothetical protein